MIAVEALCDAEGGKASPTMLCSHCADEIDAIGTKRFDSETSGDREVQRTMLELLNQLDGFGSDENIKARIGCAGPLCMTCFG